MFVCILFIQKVSCYVSLLKASASFTFDVLKLHHCCFFLFDVFRSYEGCLIYVNILDIDYFNLFSQLSTEEPLTSYPHGTDRAVVGTRKKSNNQRSRKTPFNNSTYNINIM